MGACGYGACAVCALLSGVLDLSMPILGVRDLRPVGEQHIGALILTANHRANGAGGYIGLAS